MHIGLEDYYRVVKKPYRQVNYALDISIVFMTKARNLPKSWIDISKDSEYKTRNYEQQHFAISQRNKGRDVAWKIAVVICQ